MQFCDKETLKSLTEQYSDSEIAKQFNTSAVVVQRLRLVYRIKRNRTYPLNESFFDVIDTPEKAYVLGLIMADGHIKKSGMGITLSMTESDRQIIEDVRTAIGSTAPIGICNPGRQAYKNSLPVARINFCSMRLASRLDEIGLHHDKSITASYPLIPHHLESHFVRGFSDGNGSITSTYFSMVGTKMLLEGIQDAFLRHTDCKLFLYPHSKSTHVHVLRGNGKAAEEAVRWMYQNPTLRLQRKYDKYLAYWHETSRT